MTTPEMSMALADQPCFALQTTSFAITRAYKELLAPLDLTYTQYTIMLALWERDGLALRELSEKLQTDPPSLTPVIRRLEEKRLLTRERDENDERRLVIALTDKGVGLQDSARHIPYQMMSDVGLNETEARELIAHLARMRESLSD